MARWYLFRFLWLRAVGGFLGDAAGGPCMGGRGLAASRPEAIFATLPLPTTLFCQPG